MNILFPADTNSKDPTNPYLIQLIESLSRHSSVRQVAYGADILHWSDLEWDVIHFQWPEAVFGWKKPGWRESARVEARLKSHKQRAKIIATVHNHDPAPFFHELGADVFELIYSHTDAFIHLGRASLEAFQKRYSGRSWIDRARHWIVPHGDYSYYDRFQKDAAILEHLPQDGASVILVFGGLRSAEEESLARRAFLAANLSDARLIFAGTPARNKIPRDVLRGAADPPGGRIVRLHRRIPHGQIEPLFEAAQLVFIPRTGRLNSGVLPLALTYGIPVVAPAEGVIGEMVEEAGGFLYEPANIMDAANQLRRASMMSSGTRRELIKQMTEYRTRALSWSSIARQHLEIYVDSGAGTNRGPERRLHFQRLSRSWRRRTTAFSEPMSATAGARSKLGIPGDKTSSDPICFTIALNGYENRFRECIETQERYCLRYGYRYWLVSELPWQITSRQCAWLKVEIMRGLFANGAQQIGFLDADCEFRPHAPPFERNYTDRTSLLVALGKSGRLNTGIMFARSDSELLDFLEMLISKSDLEVPKEDRTAYENGHFIHYGKNARFIGLLEHQKWNNNSYMDTRSYVQHYSGGELRRWWDANKKHTDAIPVNGGDKEDLTGMPIYEFLLFARDRLSSKYSELVTTRRKILVN